MLQNLHHAIHRESDIVKSCWLYTQFEAASQNNATAEYTTLIADLEHEMAEQEDTTMKEPRPNNPEEAKEYQKQTKKALQKFTERIHSFDRYQHESAYEFYVHDVLNELLHTDNSYYKNAEIQLVLDTIHDKMCKFVLQPDDIDEQPLQQQSPGDILEAEEITDKLAEIKDMEELDERSVKSITGSFHHTTDVPVQPSGLEVFKIAFNIPRNKRRNWHKPVLTQTIPPGISSSCTQTPHRCLAAVIHTILQRHLFNSKESTSTISEEFQVNPKKLYEGLTGKQYDPGQKFTKAVKAA